MDIPRRPIGLSDQHDGPLRYQPRAKAKAKRCAQKRGDQHEENMADEFVAGVEDQVGFGDHSLSMTGQFDAAIARCFRPDTQYRLRRRSPVRERTAYGREWTSSPNNKCQ